MLLAKFIQNQNDKGSLKIKGCKKLTPEYQKKIKFQMKSIKKQTYFIYSLFSIWLVIYDIYMLIHTE